MTLDSIRLVGVKQNNLKNIDVNIPLGQLIVVTGVSGSGKSSLVFETLHAEGQRRYVETFSPYTRQFLEMMDQPDIQAIDNIRPSIAIEQSHSVKTSRSTVGTMTELCDYFKVWFSHESDLIDPHTGKVIRHTDALALFKEYLKTHPKEVLHICFKIEKPKKFDWSSILQSLMKQGYARLILNGECIKTETLLKKVPKDDEVLYVIEDRLEIEPKNKKRFIEAIKKAFHFGQDRLYLFDPLNKLIATHTKGLVSPATGKHYRPAQANLFSFNSPIGACPECRGFGRIIDIDYSLVIPDPSLSIDDGAIRPFQGNIFEESYKDLKKVSKRLKIPTHIPWAQLGEKEKHLVIEGEPGYGTEGKHWPDAWYGIKGFFRWLESKAYKMHIRVFLSKYRTYTPCPHCKGQRLQEEALNWKWLGKTLPELYQLPIEELLTLVESSPKKRDDRSSDLALETIKTRLRYLEAVGLGYLSLDRTSRTLSGGEAQRVHLTRCLGTSLTDTLFVLDEPSIGLHAQNISRLIDILKQLTAQGNTVVVVEHDEAVMQAANHIIEMGPKAGEQGGYVHFCGSPAQIKKDKNSLTGAYLSNKKTIPIPKTRRKINTETPYIELKGVCKHNLKNLDVTIPLERLVCLSGVSGSGKSTLLTNALHQGLLKHLGRPAQDPATIATIKTSKPIKDIALIDQAAISKTPRSNPILYIDGWDLIRTLFAKTPEAVSACFTNAHFSFNSGQGRCEHCQGLGFEKTEMQFLADIYTTCPICSGERFKHEVLQVIWQGKNVAQILSMTVEEALDFFNKEKKIIQKLDILKKVGLGYLRLGQPLNTLSGGESQRIKLVKYFSALNTDTHSTVLLLDEPTTGLHRHDIAKLVKVFNQLVDQGHSVIVIEHQMDILSCADWLIELGPQAGSKGGKIVAQGTPEMIAKKKTATARYLKAHLNPSAKKLPLADTAKPALPLKTYCKDLKITGAREHNLKNISLTIPHGQLSVVTGVSGSGKSSLAFDIIFSEGQRRYMESLSSYARQFVEQFSKPDIDSLVNIPPTVAIEQRLTQGNSKSTVATVTEVAQYLRLLYAKVGIQHSPSNDSPVVSLSYGALKKHVHKHLLKASKTAMHHLCAPLVRARKGHYQPLAQWAQKAGYTHMRIDGKLTPLSTFKPLDRYKEHDIELVIASFRAGTLSLKDLDGWLNKALTLGSNSCFIFSSQNSKASSLTWFSTQRTDPLTGESFPELDPKHFSWNSPKGWCATCRGHGWIYPWMLKNEDYPIYEKNLTDGNLCPECSGARLNRISRHVKLHFKNISQEPLALPQLLQSTPEGLLDRLSTLKLDSKGMQIFDGIYPQIKERLNFMEQVGLNYLTLDRSSNTLSGGEAQRIRLASQLGSQLSGVLYILDEPSIGLHAKDNESLINSLHALRKQGNTLLVVEHDEDTLRAANHIIDLGPQAGIHGGNIIAQGSPKQVLKNKSSLTAQYLKNPIKHPLKGHYRPLPKGWTPKTSKADNAWLVLRNPSFRNLKGDTLFIPKGRLSVICGLSGAGKSTLIRGLLKPVLQYALKEKLPNLKYKQLPSNTFPNYSNKKPLFKELLGCSLIKNVIEMNQDPIGKTPRSIPATYIKAMDLIREAFAKLPEARMHGHGASFFSFNTQGGRCEKCKGAGRIKLEMHFLPDTYISCEDCNGTRYGPQVHDIRWNGKNIADILLMSFEEAADFFAFDTKLKDLFSLMVETGLGYIRLGQSSPTLSGGEAQRLKMVSELAKGLPTFREKTIGSLPSNLYILEEPTIGLHLHDCKRLIDLLHRLVDQGHTVIVIEHHLDLIAEADYVVELGPRPGDKGGQIIYQGATQDLLKVRQSPTAPFLKKYLIKPTTR